MHRYIPPNSDLVILFADLLVIINLRAVKKSDRSLIEILDYYIVNLLVHYVQFGQI
jgi:hypothetical protein